ncbi:MAG TPA: UDP-phosphate galactose phosphotransferase [Rhodospirillaceae bacterium]|nr:UDP-phosphate galactose phosphotransferase [Rhodospirillaceae bacterium]
MSPREAFRRLRSPVSAPHSPSSDDISTSERAKTRLTTIMAEISAMPVTDFFPQTQTQARRHPSDALRWFILSDIFALLWGFAIAWSAASVINTTVLGRSFESLSLLAEGLRFSQFVMVSLGVVLWFCHTGQYKTRMPFWFETQTVVKTLGFALIVDGFFQFAAKQDPSRLWLTSAWLFAGFALLSSRFLVRASLRRSQKWQLRTLLVGSGIMADETRAALRSEPELGYEIAMQIENLPLLLEQTDNSWERLCARFNADYVVIAMDGLALADAGEAIAQLAREGIPFSISPPLRHLPVLGMTPQYFFNHDVMLMTHISNLEQPLPRFLKRSLDIFGAGIGLFFLSPLLISLALLVRRDGGPVFYGDKRMGLNGRPFMCLKFRSMVQNSEAVLEAFLEKNLRKKAEWECYHKLREGDPRITKIGQFMRRWSLDELPQLINVLRGDMSLVGPRPIKLAEKDAYDRDISLYRKVRPGLTGLWQVSGRSNLSFSRRVQMDGWYVRNWSLWHDIAILFKTIPAVLKKTGAC